jgi:diguanylate cyclase (GGDEF)-like protein
MSNQILKDVVILYVEDEDDIRNEVVESISFLVGEIIVATNGAEGLEKYNQHNDKIDLIISDILMPKLNGIEMIKKIRAIDHNIPIILTTAFSDTEYLREAIELSVDSYVLKPIDIEELYNAIQKASVKIENAKLKDELNKTLERLKHLNSELEEEIKAQISDIQELNQKLEKKNEELLKQLLTDELTGLKNRRALIEDMTQIKNPCVIIIDIDSFHTINTLYGIEAGSHLLVDFANFLRQFWDNAVSICRIGSDEFVVLKKSDNKEEIEELITIFQRKLEYSKFKHYQIKTIDIQVDATIGIALNCDADCCLKNADMALKRAKQLRENHLFYSGSIDMESNYENYVKWTRVIKRAIDNNDVIIYYQPIVNFLQNEKKYECLIRIKYKDKIIPPFYFLDIAKQAKYYTPLTKIVIDKAFQTIKKDNIKLTINLSLQDILNQKIVRFIFEKLGEYGIASNVTFEILESESIYNFDEAFSFIRKVQQLGAKIAIDDFGSGYSNFSYLMKMKPDYIKIDGDLIKSIDTDRNAYLIVETIVETAKKLGIKTIAEHISSEEIYLKAIELEIDEYQGYYFSKPKETL